MSTVPEEPATAISKIDTAAAKLEQARVLNIKLQKMFASGSEQWHLCEAIDDKLFDAVAALGK